MAKKKYCYADWDSSMWLKTPDSYKTLAKKIYKACKKSKNKKETFVCDKPNYIANAIGFQFFRYDVYTGSYNWYQVGKVNGSKCLIINITKFNKLLVRNIQIENEIKRIKSYLKLVKKTPYDKAYVIHDYLCECADYNYAFLTDENNSMGTELYDVLFAHSAICCGYSDTFKAICDNIGLECECVSNKDHEWNRVKIDDKWLYLDITWDDNADHTINRKYCLLAEDEFYEVHPKHTKINYDVWEV